MLQQVSAVLAYSHENAVEPFLEPVLGLYQALLEKDQQDMHRNMEGRSCNMQYCTHLVGVMMHVAPKSAVVAAFPTAQQQLLTSFVPVCIEGCIQARWE